MFMNFCHNIEKELASGISIWTALLDENTSIGQSRIIGSCPRASYYIQLHYLLPLPNAIHYLLPITYMTLFCGRGLG